MRIDLGGLSLHVARDGDSAKPALILAHPLGGDISVWDDILPALTPDFHVIRYDSRGHGASDSPPGPYALDDLGRDALALMDALGVTKAHFLGLSMGGLVGQWLMLHAPERLGKVVLANTAAHLPDPDGWNGRIRIVRESGMAGLVPTVLSRWLSPAFQQARPDSAQKIEKLLLANRPAGYAACCAALRDCDLRNALRAAPARPVLVIIGETDATTPPARGEFLARVLPQARLLRLNAAHVSCVEAAAEFGAAVRAFLKD
jgi:3-oxoadipate enol-lactonase